MKKFLAAWPSAAFSPRRFSPPTGRSTRRSRPSRPSARRGQAQGLLRDEQGDVVGRRRDDKAEALDKQMDGFMKDLGPEFQTASRPAPTSIRNWRQQGLRRRHGQARRQVRQVSARADPRYGMSARPPARAASNALEDLTPVAERGVDQRQRGDRRRVGAHDARAERNRAARTACRAAARALRLEAAFRSDEHGERPGATRQAPRAGSHVGGLIAEDELCASASQPASTASSFSGSSTVGTRSTPHCSAASMALARMRSMLTRSATVSPRQHRRQPRDPHLGRLLHHIVEPRALERRKEIVEVGATLLRPHLRPAFERAAPLAGLGERARHSPSRPLKTRMAPSPSRSTLTR